jgi:hypothetical protein
VDVSTLRSQQGKGYCTSVTGDLTIRWKPLSIEEFFHYDDAFRSGVIAPAVLEDEIFCSCVVDQEYVRDIDWLPAGTVDLVVQNILSFSGPASIDEFNDFLEVNRSLVNTPLHQMAPLILRAFPSYKLEDVYAMPYETFMFRLAQAEAFLLRLGIIQEPLSLVSDKKPKKRQLSPEQLKQIWDQQNTKPEKFSKETGIFQKGKAVRMKNLDNERVTAEQAVGSEEDNDLRAKMISEAANVYKDSLSKLEFYQKK